MDSTSIHTKNGTDETCVDRTMKLVAERVDFVYLWRTTFFTSYTLISQNLTTQAISQLHSYVHAGGSPQFRF